MKILGIDSSGLTASVALYDNGKIVAVNSVNNNKTHSQTLLPMVMHVMEQAEIDIDDIDAIAVAEGPGSFTGLRIGAATVKGLALASKKTVVPVSTLEGLAYIYAGSDGYVCPVMDARRGQVYTAVYTFDGTNLSEMTELEAPQAVDCEEILDKLNEICQDKRIYFMGDGVLVHEEKIRNKIGERAVIAEPHKRFQDAAAVAVLGAKKYEKGVCVTGAEFEPVYLRLSQAERERMEKEKGNN